MRIDYRELKAGRDLDKIIAEMIGWTDISENQFSKLFGTNPNGFREIVPYWSRDLNDAFLKLPLEANTYMSLRTPQNGLAYTGFVYYETPTENDFRSAVADAPALAICRAWLAWNTRAK